MSRKSVAVRGALLLGALGAMAACDSGGAHVLGPNVKNAIFQSYVAIGNSITAGYQSGGINDSTQRQSYAFLLARQMGTRFAYPSLTLPGCPPPLNNLLTQTRVGGATPTTCALRALGATFPATLNNVAVPGAASADPTSQLGPAASALTELILGGETMVQKAIDARPTFATVWIGNNDILGPATNGLPSTATPIPTFVANYSKMITQLLQGAQGLKGVLIAVAQVTNVPLMIPAAAFADPTVRGAAGQVAGRAVALDPVTCDPAVGINALIDFQYLGAIRLRPAALPGTIYCQKISGGGQSDLGDFLVLDPGEIAAVNTLINGYNTYIKAKADSIGFAYYDPNPTLAGLRANGSVPVFPNLASVPQPFGQYFSIDGVHPAAAAHILITNDLIGVINAKFQTSLTPLPTS